MMVNVLCTLGLDSLELVEGILRNLIPQERQASEWQKIRYLVSKPGEQAELRTRSARKIAIEVASTLKVRPILQTAALHTDPTMRAMAVRYTYYLWQHDRDAGFGVIQYLADKATTGVIPNFPALESIFSVSLIVACDSYHEGALSRLQIIWHGMIAKLFRVREGASPLGRILRDFVYDRLISFIITYVFWLLREMPPNNIIMMDSEIIEAFFKLNLADKYLYRRLVRYFDVNGNYSREHMEDDYLAVLKIDNILPRLTTSMGLVAHACAAPHTFLPFLKQLFEAAKSDSETYPYLTVIYNVAINVLFRDKMNDDMFEFLIYTAEVCQECYTQHPEKYHNRYAAAPQALGVGIYILFQYQRAGMVRTAWLQTRIQAALDGLVGIERDSHLKFFEFLLTSEFPQLVLHHREPKAALAALELFFKSVVLTTGRNRLADTPDARTRQLEGLADITDMIQAFLSRLRVYYPDQVEHFLEEQQAPDEFRLQVRTHEPSEVVADLIGMRAWYFVRDGALLGPAERCAQLMGFFEKAAAYNDTRGWMNYVIRHLVNLIYGGEALREF